MTSQPETTSPTDDECRAAIAAMEPDRIQGFISRLPNGEWGPPHWIRDVWRKPEEQEIWRGDSDEEMMERCAIERMRLGLAAAAKVRNDNL